MLFPFADAFSEPGKLETSFGSGFPQLGQEDGAGCFVILAGSVGE
jgi:hypothetical protein